MDNLSASLVKLGNGFRKRQLIRHFLNDIFIGGRERFQRGTVLIVSERFLQGIDGANGIQRICDFFRAHLIEVIEVKVRIFISDIRTVLGNVIA